MTREPDLSVVIPVGRRVDDLIDLYHSYKAGLDAWGGRYEVVFVLDGPMDSVRETLRALMDDGESIRVVQLGKSFGEATALMAGFENSAASKLLTLPAYFQVEGSELVELLAASEDCDMVVARRWPRRGSQFEHLRRAGFHGLLKLITGEAFSDLGCGVRVLDRAVVDEITIYGDQHRLLPVLAAKHGFRVREIDLSQSPKDAFLGRYRLREYLHRILDVLTVFFLIRFTRKPLRFFGMIGSVMFGIGAVAIVVLVVQRLVFAQALADRPALLLSSLLIVLGAQLFALGLLGELIIFTHARDIKEYRVAEVVEAKATARDSVRERHREVATL